MNADDAESFMMVRVYKFVENNPKYQTKKGIRQVIKTRTLDFLKSSSNTGKSHTKTDLVVDYTNGEQISAEEAELRGLDLSLCQPVYQTRYTTDSFSNLSSQDDEGSETDFESTFESTNQVNIATSVVEGTLLADFLATLSDRQRVIVELRAGILDSLSADELAIAKSIMDKQSSKVSGEVYLSNSDIAKIIGIGRVKVQNHLARIAEKALDFGLEEI
jgi:hypothetical protein